MKETQLKASDPCELERLIMDSNIAKNESAWWAKREIESLRAQVAELKAENERDKEGVVCGDCDGSGWLENRVDGRHPCTCMTEAEPYQLLEEERDELKVQLAEYKGLLSNLMEVVEEPPESNCSCHISPPCSDCVEWSGLREALSEARTAMKGVTE